MKKILSTSLKYIIPLVIGVGLFYFLYTNVDVNKVLESIRFNVNFWWFVPIIIVSICSHVFRAFRWRLQLRALGINAPLNAIINSIFGTYAVNLAFPRLGEVWRTGYIANRQKAPFSTVFGSMVADRMTDTVTVLALSIFTFCIAQDAFNQFLDTYPQIKDGLWDSITSPISWAAVCFAIIALVWLFSTSSQNMCVIKVKEMVIGLWNGFYAVTKMKGKWWFLLYTFLIWGCYFMQLYLAKYAFSFTESLSLKAMLVLFVLSSIGMGIPTNGGLGAWHVAIIFGLSLYGVGAFDTNNFDPHASAFAMLVWGVQTILLIALGIYAFTFIAIDKHRINSGKTKVDYYKQ